MGKKKNSFSSQTSKKKEKKEEERKTAHLHSLVLYTWKQDACCHCTISLTRLQSNVVLQMTWWDKFMVNESERAQRGGMF
jgi:hypothetical protein